MTESAELAGWPGTIEQVVEPTDLPESFEWGTDSGLLSVPLAEVESSLIARIDDPKGVPLAFPERAASPGVVVEVATVRREDRGLIAVVRERSGTGAPTAS